MIGVWGPWKEAEREVLPCKTVKQKFEHKSPNRLNVERQVKIKKKLKCIDWGSYYFNVLTTWVGSCDRPEKRAKSS